MVSVHCYTTLFQWLAVDTIRGGKDHHLQHIGMELPTVQDQYNATLMPMNNHGLMNQLNMAMPK